MFLTSVGDLTGDCLDDRVCDRVGDDRGIVERVGDDCCGLVALRVGDDCGGLVALCVVLIVGNIGHVSAGVIGMLSDDRQRSYGGGLARVDIVPAKTIID